MPLNVVNTIPQGRYYNLDTSYGSLKLILREALNRGPSKSYLKRSGTQAAGMSTKARDFFDGGTFLLTGAAGDKYSQRVLLRVLKSLPNGATVYTADKDLGQAIAALHNFFKENPDIARKSATRSQATIAPLEKPLAQKEVVERIATAISRHPGSGLNHHEVVSWLEGTLKNTRKDRRVQQLLVGMEGKAPSDAMRDPRLRPLLTSLGDSIYALKNRERGKIDEEAVEGRYRSGYQTRQLEKRDEGARSARDRGHRKEDKAIKDYLAKEMSQGRLVYDVRAHARRGYVPALGAKKSRFLERLLEHAGMLKGMSFQKMLEENPEMLLFLASSDAQTGMLVVRKYLYDTIDMKTGKQVQFTKKEKDRILERGFFPGYYEVVRSMPRTIRGAKAFVSQPGVKRLLDLYQEEKWGVTRQEWTKAARGLRGMLSHPAIPLNDVTTLHQLSELVSGDPKVVNFFSKHFLKLGQTEQLAFMQGNNQERLEIANAFYQRSRRVSSGKKEDILKSDTQKYADKETGTLSGQSFGQAGRPRSKRGFSDYGSNPQRELEKHLDKETLQAMKKRALAEIPAEEWGKKRVWLGKDGMPFFDGREISAGKLFGGYNKVRARLDPTWRASDAYRTFSKISPKALKKDTSFLEAGELLDLNTWLPGAVSMAFRFQMRAHKAKSIEELYDVQAHFQRVFGVLPMETHHDEGDVFNHATLIHNYVMREIRERAVLLRTSNPEDLEVVDKKVRNQTRKYLVARRTQLLHDLEYAQELFPKIAAESLGVELPPQALMEPKPSSKRRGRTGQSMDDEVGTKVQGNVERGYSHNFEDVGLTMSHEQLEAYEPNAPHGPNPSVGVLDRLKQPDEGAAPLGTPFGLNVGYASFGPGQENIEMKLEELPQRSQDIVYGNIEKYRKRMTGD